MKKLLFIIIAYSLLLAGCGENEAIYYEGESDNTSGVYFAYYTSTTRQGTSITYHYNDTTINNSLTSVVGEYAQLRIPVRLFGNVSEEDRPFVVKDTIDAQRITIRYSLVFEKPFSWDFYKTNWGEYSHTKLNFILSVVGWTYSQFSQKNFYYVSPSICLLTRMELQKRADEGNPVRELDGSLMQLGSNYLVDYSAYE